MISISISDQIAEAAAHVDRLWPERPKLALILGTGLGAACAEIECATAIPYADIPHFPCSTALSHRGRLVCGWLAGTPVIAMDGRCHLYEGYSADHVVVGVRVLQRLGAEALLVTNASGGLNPQLGSGDIVVMTGHINLMGRTRCTRFMAPASDAAARSASPYCQVLAEIALRAARRHDFRALPGTYVSVLGPNYETRAEYRFMRRIGGDVVGMSTYHEVMAALELGMRVLALSVVTNVANPDAPRVTTGSEVVNIASLAGEKLRTIIRDVAAHLDARE